MVAELKAQTDQRFEAMSAKYQSEIDRLRSKAPRESKETQTPGPAQAGGLSEGDVEALIRLGELTANLNPEQRERARSLKQRHGAQATVDIMEALLQGSPAATPDRPRATAPTGHAATAAHSPAPGWPSKREYVELVRNRATDKAAAARLSALQDDPAFDPNTLK